MNTRSKKGDTGATGVDPDKLYEELGRCKLGFESCCNQLEEIFERNLDDSVKVRLDLVVKSFETYNNVYNEFVACKSVGEELIAEEKNVFQVYEERMATLQDRVDEWCVVKSKACSEKMADLQISRLKKQHEYERQKEELRRSHEMSNLQAKLAEIDIQCELDDISDCKSDKSKRFNKPPLPDHLLSQPNTKLQTSMYVNKHMPEKPQDDSSYAVTELTEATSTAYQSGRSSRTSKRRSAKRRRRKVHGLDVELPRPVLPIFNGDPSQYSLFIHTFESCIESNIKDPALRLTYLIQHCSGPAKLAIQDYVLMDKCRGFTEARKTLYRRLGRPHLIAHSLIRQLISGPAIAYNDGEGLINLATEMQRCDLIMSNLEYVSDMNNMENLLKIIHRLPPPLQYKWADYSYEIMLKRREANFKDLFKFILRSAEVANTYYGQNISRMNKAIQSTKRYIYNITHGDYESEDATINNITTAHSILHCPYCEGNHTLSDCAQFANLNLTARRDFMRENKRCFNCLQEGHASRGCLHSNRCPITSCGERHHRLFHYTPRSNNTTQNNTNGNLAHTTNNHINATGAAVNNALNANCNATTKRGNVSLRILPVRLVANNKVITTNAFLDCGSDVTLCTKEILQLLGCKVSERKMLINTLNNSKVNNVSKASLILQSFTNNHMIEVDEVYGVDELPSLRGNIVDVSQLGSWSHLAGLDIPQVNDTGIGILIGANVPEAFFVQEQRRGGHREPYAIRTALGWTLMGPLNSLTSSSAQVNHVSHDVVLTKQVERFWEIDFPDIDDDSLGMSKNDLKALKILEDNYRWVNGHYQLPLPFKRDPVQLSNNYSMASQRLSCLKRRLAKDDSLRKKYANTVEEYINKGWAKEVLDINTNSSLVNDLYFLPHHPVMHPRKPGKVRVVFDCAAQFKESSLNANLYSGPDLANNLLGVLLRFRQYSIAIVGDVEAMFHQVLVKSTHKKFMSFLWWPGGNIDTVPKVYQMQVHIFGARSSPCCANFALRRTAEDNKADFDQLSISTVMSNFYVDDYLMSVPDAETAINLRKNVCDIVKRGGFNLTKWCSNDRETLNSIPVELRSPSFNTFNLDLDDLPNESALGVRWNAEKDRIELSVKLLKKPISRRGILSVVSSIYDPLGIVVPYCLAAKLLLQDLCRRKLSWDQLLDEADRKTWENWLSGVQQLSDLWIKRVLVPSWFGTISSTEIHIFCDASRTAYSAVSYLRLVNERGEILCQFILGKSRLAPIKGMTIPRLELSAAVLAVRLGNIINKELQLKINKTTFWSDSTIVLQYINNASKRFQVFVANRLRKITNFSSVGQWRHVNGEENPADDGTRGFSVKQMNSQCRWLAGPTFLLQPDDQWTSCFAVPELPDDEPELIKVNVCSIEVKSCLLIEFMEQYSDLHRLLKATVWHCRFINFLRKLPFTPRSITVDELQSSKLRLIKFLQRSCFQFIDFTKPKLLSKTKLPRFMQKLHPLICDGILRVGGRLTNSPMTFEEKHPIILPNKCHFTDLIIRQHHQINGHTGPSQTWTSIREHFWIVNGGVEVRRVLSSCFDCKRRNAKVGVQIMASLPACRITPNLPPFYTTGLDFFGPFLVRRGRSDVKRYGCIFTCLTSRAVHLEVAHGLDTSSFLNVFTRFICRRGKPHSIYSDNGTNFVGGQRILSKCIKEWNEGELTSFLQQSEIRWIFNPPGASHMGGIWERLIRSVRKILYHILLSQTVTDDALNTIFVEVEHILNSRPLTPISIDAKDGEPITPNHLLNVSRSYNLPPGIFKERDIYSHNRWRQIQYVTDQFWAKWSKEYLPLLQARQKWVKSTKNFAIGDLVVIADGRVPKRWWPLGQVVQVYPDKEGHVRQVDVKTKDSVVRRPISKLCFLESSTITY